MKGGKKVKEKQRRTSHCCARKNDQLTYSICNMILLPSSSTVLLTKLAPGEREGGREGQRLKSVVAMKENRITTNTVLGREGKREGGEEGGREGEVNSDVGTPIRDGTSHCSQATSCFCKLP